MIKEYVDKQAGSVSDLCSSALNQMCWMDYWCSMRVYKKGFGCLTLPFLCHTDVPQMQCIRAFVAQQPDELSLDKADIILVHQSSDRKLTSAAFPSFMCHSPMHCMTVELLYTFHQ